jgi:hypothetical protein
MRLLIYCLVYYFVVAGTTFDTVSCFVETSEPLMRLGLTDSAIIISLMYWIDKVLCFRFMEFQTR